MANKKLKLLYLAQYLQEETDERHPRTVQDMIAYPQQEKGARAMYECSS